MFKVILPYVSPMISRNQKTSSNSTLKGIMSFISLQVGIAACEFLYEWRAIVMALVIAVIGLWTFYPRKKFVNLPPISEEVLRAALRAPTYTSKKPVAEAQTQTNTPTYQRGYVLRNDKVIPIRAEYIFPITAIFSC